MNLISNSCFKAALVLAAATALRAQPAEAADYARATRFLGQRLPDQAIPILESLVIRSPEFYRAYDALAEAYLQKHAPGVGTSYFAGLVGDPDRRAFANFGLGRITIATGDWAHALEYLSACVQQRPNSVPCYRYLVTAFLVMTNRTATPESLAAQMGRSIDSPYSCLGFTEMAISQRRISDALRSAQTCLAQARAVGQGDFLLAAMDLNGRSV